MLKEVKPPLDRKIIKLLTFDYDILVFYKTRSRMTMTITFSRQNDVGSRALRSIGKISFS